MCLKHVQGIIWSLEQRGWAWISVPVGTSCDVIWGCNCPTAPVPRYLHHQDTCTRSTKKCDTWQRGWTWMLVPGVTSEGGHCHTVRGTTARGGVEAEGRPELLSWPTSIASDTCTFTRVVSPLIHQYCQPLRSQDQDHQLHLYHQHQGGIPSDTCTNIVVTPVTNLTTKTVVSPPSITAIAQKYRKWHLHHTPAQQWYRVFKCNCYYFFFLTCGMHIFSEMTHV